MPLRFRIRQTIQKFLEVWELPLIQIIDMFGARRDNLVVVLAVPNVCRQSMFSIFRWLRRRSEEKNLDSFVAHSPLKKQFET